MTGDHSGESGKQGRPGEKTYLCQKTGKRIPASAPRCPKPNEACKYRLERIIYALYKDAQDSAGPQPSGTEGGAERSSTRFTERPISVRRQRTVRGSRHSFVVSRNRAALGSTGQLSTR